ncbi:hypothetical protein BDW02DRAFT_574990 [Decorospora gaudefroyi]|uniref:RING-type domain-containing protein n=1 Tax=Decorospora gaudefroyi TaxID=184978 RepID=A0A6A5K1B2_9PLEO|nr:hypothetical protein BDW02DRAFT_574990 [Decorospora gaudefroyi]
MKAVRGRAHRALFSLHRRASVLFKFQLLRGFHSQPPPVSLFGTVCLPHVQALPSTHLSSRQHPSVMSHHPPHFHGYPQQPHPPLNNQVDGSRFPPPSYGHRPPSFPLVASHEPTGSDILHQDRRRSAYAPGRWGNSLHGFHESLHRAESHLAPQTMPENNSHGELYHYQGLPSDPSLPTSNSESLFNTYMQHHYRQGYSDVPHPAASHNTQHGQQTNLQHVPYTTHLAQENLTYSYQPFGVLLPNTIRSSVETTPRTRQQSNFPPASDMEHFGPWRGMYHQREQARNSVDPRVSGRHVMVARAQRRKPSTATIQKYTALPASDPSHDAECPICQEPYCDREHVAIKLQNTHCDHVFGRTCLQEWVNSGMDNAHRCPICRQSIVSALTSPSRSVDPIFEIRARQEMERQRELMRQEPREQAVFMESGRHQQQPVSVRSHQSRAIAWEEFRARRLSTAPHEPARYESMAQEQAPQAVRTNRPITVPESLWPTANAPANSGVQDNSGRLLYDTTPERRRAARSQEGAARVREEEANRRKARISARTAALCKARHAQLLQRHQDEPAPRASRGERM